MPVGRGRKSQDRLAHARVPVQARPTVRDAAADRAVLVSQVLHRLGQVVGDALGRRTQGVRQGPERAHLRGDLGVVPFDQDQLGEVDARDRRAAVGPPVVHHTAGHGHLVGSVVAQRRCDEVGADAQVLARQLADLLGQRGEDVEVGPGLPGRRDRGREGVHERVHVRAGQVVLLVPGGSREDDVREQGRRGHPEVHRQQQVELALRGLFVPGDVTRTQSLGRLLGP